MDEKLENFRVVEDHAVFRPAGEVSIMQAARLVKSAIESARAQGIRKLMVVTNDLTGFEPPKLGLRSLIVQEWVRAANGVVSVAMVARPEFIDPNKLGAVVAKSGGMAYDIFESEEHALAWLRSLREGTTWRK